MQGETINFQSRIKPAWSGTLDTKTMTIQTEDGCKYKDVYYNGGSSMKLYEWGDVSDMNFSEIFFPTVDRCFDDQFYLRMVVKVHGECQCVYFKRVD